ncbi:hypothetical protein ALI144C_35845 [Actinosynnema sp. ALI-1.44]|uniref:hypothetical protein n=1 Tax=Actinosynnema sp. ALI-1.44 TaxID=1933779 RepID=UPI0009C43E5C|nr:hypothetical protein [Actinosynnema sp. ALI-1.44]ONI76074.1 hypothetical protein ALI144C_35845 [Actinosynnema sp. ALI-1.44]
MPDDQDRPSVSEQPPPSPGQQFPAAVLPTSDYQSSGDSKPPTHNSGPTHLEPFSPSGSIPAQPAIDVAQQFPPSQPFPTTQSTPRNKVMTALIVLAVIFFLGTGAFAALWLVEQGDHKGTTSELQTVRADLTKTADELKGAQQARSQSEADKQRLQRDVEHAKPCLDSAKRFVRALTDADADKQFDEMMINC